MLKKIENENLLLKLKKFEKFWKIDIEKDQYFIINQKIIDHLIKIADVKKNESILEIGTGLGFVTFPSAIVHFQRIVDPEKTKNYQIFIKRWLYKHENWKLKNALREGIITAGKRIKNQFITKNQAREIIRKIGIEDKDLEKMVSQIELKFYFEITKKIVDFLI